MFSYKISWWSIR